MKRLFYAQASCIVMVLLYALPAAANPLVWEEDPMHRLLPLLTVVVLLLAEGIILFTLVRTARPYFFRFVGAWFAVTSITYILLITSLNPLVYYPYYKTLEICGEVTVTVIEGIALYYLVRSPRIIRIPEAAPSLMKCWLFSLIANAFSYTGGLLSEDLLHKLHKLIKVLNW